MVDKGNTGSGCFRLTEAEISLSLRDEMESFRRHFPGQSDATFEGWRDDTREFLGFLPRERGHAVKDTLCLKDCADADAICDFYKFKRDVRAIAYPKKFLNSMSKTIRFLGDTNQIEEPKLKLLSSQIKEIKDERSLGSARTCRPEPELSWPQLRKVHEALRRASRLNPGDERIQQHLVALSCFVLNPPLRMSDFREAIIRTRNDVDTRKVLVRQASGTSRQWILYLNIHKTLGKRSREKRTLSPELSEVISGFVDKWRRPGEPLFKNTAGEQYLSVSFTGYVANLGKKPCIPGELQCKTGAKDMRTAFVSWYLDQGYTDQENRDIQEYLLRRMTLLSADQFCSAN
eukprot:COSAG02_NODE_911_length_16005_cov_9.262983_7_plen_346_part_00